MLCILSFPRLKSEQSNEDDDNNDNNGDRDEYDSVLRPELLLEFERFDVVERSERGGCSRVG